MRFSHKFRLRGEGPLLPVPVANAGAEPHVAARAAGKFDEAILIERGYSARGRLPAHPVGLFGQADGVPASRQRQRGGDAAHARARDQGVATDFLHPLGHRHMHDRARRVSR